MTQEDKGREIVWGPEICPSELSEGIDRNGRAAWNCGDPERGDGGWFGIGETPYYVYDRMDRDIGVRLPADHPQYAAQQRRTAPSGGDVVSSDVVARMIAFFRRLDGWDGSYALASDMTEARAIVALLPAEVDGDLLEARKLCAASVRNLPKDACVMLANGTRVWGDAAVRAIESGDADDASIIQDRLAAIKLGRALASGEG